MSTGVKCNKKYYRTVQREKTKFRGGVVSSDGYESIGVCIYELAKDEPDDTVELLSPINVSSECDIEKCPLRGE